MDNFDTTNSNFNDPASEQTETELSHSDKIVGILSEPKNTFDKISHFPARTIDWLLPITLMLVVIAITNIIIMSNPEIKLQAREKQIEQMRKGFDEAVAKGNMTREQADQQIENMQDRMDSMGMGLQFVIASVSIIIGGFIFFFIMAGIYFLFIKFILKGDGSFGSVLVASGLTGYIGIIQVIVAAVLSMLFSRLMHDTSVAAILNTDKATFLGWFEGKIDPFSIWVYIVLSIGFAKLFKSSSAVKYFALVFGIWIIGSFLIFILAKSVPFLRWFSA